MKRILLLLIGGGILLTCPKAQENISIPLSYFEALKRLEKSNRSLQIADKAVETARAEHDRLNALWLPSLQAAGSYVHLSQQVEVRQPLATYTGPAKELVQELLPDDQLITGLLDQAGGYTLTVPLLPRNLTSVGVTAEWMLFTGGKRIQADRIGQRLTELAREERRQTLSTQQVLLAESYFGLRLAQEVVRVKQETYHSLEHHYHDALKMEAAGITDKAGRLFAQVNMDEARREWEAARKEVGVLQHSLLNLLNLPDSITLQPTTALFILPALPPRELLLQTMQTSNPVVNSLHLQQEVARRELRMEQSAYLPNVALFGRQTLYAHGLPDHLMPRTVVGVGFTWNLFDGLAREKRIRQSRLAIQTLTLTREKTTNDLQVAIDKLYAQLEKAQENVRTLESSIALSEELLRIRRKSFAEGMATSTDVVDAENLLAATRTAKLAACYEFVVALCNLQALCGDSTLLPPFPVPAESESVILTVNP
ncbi:MAG: TolC family protein [Bacteroides sp.]|nr:TolC family protein [Bacteroides sp.]